MEWKSMGHELAFIGGLSLEGLSIDSDSWKMCHNDITSGPQDWPYNKLWWLTCFPAPKGHSFLNLCPAGSTESYSMLFFYHVSMSHTTFLSGHWIGAFHLSNAVMLMLHIFLMVIRVTVLIIWRCHWSVFILTKRVLRK